MSTGKNLINEPDYFQPCVIYNAHVKVGFHTEHIAYPFYSQSIFLTEKDATNFLPTFIKVLLDAGDLPQEVVLKDGTLDETKVLTSLSPVFVTEMELNAD